MTTLSQAVQEAIQKDLPGLVASELKDFIVSAEADRHALSKTREQLAAANTQVVSLNAQLTKHSELDQRKRELDDVAAKQQAAELLLLRREAQLDAAIARAELTGVKDTVGSFLRNVTVRQTIVEDVTKPVEGMAPSSGNGYSNPGCTGSLQRNHDGIPDTITKTETKE